MAMAFDLLRLRAHLYKPFAVKLDEFLPRMMLLSKGYTSMSAVNQHGHSASQAIADDYDVIRIMPGSELRKSTELAILHGAMSTGFLFTYSLRNVSASIMPVSMSPSAVAKFV